MSSQPQPQPQKSRRSFPERDSLRAILLANSTERLYAHPLVWTAEQLKHLSLELHPPELPFELHPPELPVACGVVEESPPDLQLLGDMKWSDIQDAARVCQCEYAPRQREIWMRDFIEKLTMASTGSRLYRSPLEFQYAGRTVAKIHLPLVFYNQDDIITWAYIDDISTNRQREKFHKRTRRSYVSKIRTGDEEHNLPVDPLYIATLIALAQHGRAVRRAKRARGTNVSTTLNKVSLFIPTHTRRRHFKWAPGSTGLFHLGTLTTFTQYTATFTDEYLLKFEDPDHYHSDTLHITWEMFRLAQPSLFIQAIERASTQQNVSCGYLDASKGKEALEDAL